MNKRQKISMMGGSVLAAGLVTAGAMAATNPAGNVVPGWGNGNGSVSSAAVGPDGSSVPVQQNRAIENFATRFENAAGRYRADVAGVVAASHARVSPTSGKAAVAKFDASFKSTNASFDAVVKSAEDNFRDKIDMAAGSAENKNQFIDAFNRAKADYFNELEGAKNLMADSLNRAGAAVPKDEFMNKYNARKDSYGNELEQIKNEFAATLG